MKIKTWTVGIAVLALVGSPAFAENDFGQLSIDQNVVPVGCDSCCDSDSCCDDGCGCGSGVCGGGGLLSGMGPGYLEGFTLSSALGISSFDVGGWTQFGYHDQQTPLSRTRGDLRAFNDVPKNLNLQQQWFYIGKEADGRHGLDWGFRADMVYGTDAQKTQAFGNPAGSFDEGWDNGVYGWAMPQLYGEVAMGDLNIKVGRFFTLVGYESVAAPQNFFYSRSLTAFNSEPFTHTGVLTTYTGFENLTLYGGWTLGWDSGFDQVGSGNTFIGGFSADLTDNVNLTYINTYGNFGARDSTHITVGLIPNNPDDSYSHSVVFDVSLTDNLQYIFQTDYVSYNRVSNGTPGNEQIGVNQYLIYQYNDIVSFGTRLEWWKSDTLPPPAGANIDRVSHYAITSGVNIQLLDNLVMRPEARKDWVPAAGFDEDMVGCDFILTY